MDPISFNHPGARTLEGSFNVQTAMPLGGLGAGCLCINGEGGFQDFSLRNRPELSAMPDGHGSHHDSAFGLVHVETPDAGLAQTRLLEGPLPVEKVYAFGLKGQGYRHGGKDGLSRFSRCRFSGSFPFAQVDLSDEKMPLAVRIVAWSPFVPGDARVTGIPAAVAEYAFTNTSDEPLKLSFSFHLSHLSQRKRYEGQDLSRNHVIPQRGVFFDNLEPAGSESFGSAALVSLGSVPAIKAMWFRGVWFDATSMLWKEASTGTFCANDGSDCAHAEGWNGGSVGFEAELQPGETQTFPIGIAWHFPNVAFQYGHEPRCCEPEAEPEPWWRPWYVTQWQDAKAVANELVDDYAQLRARTCAFHQALTDVTLPPEIVDAVSANLAILKSPTVLRQENGDFWAWEGCFSDRGCCHGSCTHVWNYAQALPHLFPELERTLREQEYRFSIDEDGHVGFRFAIPTTRIRQRGTAAADGQLGGLIKLYRDWQMSGSDQWLGELYPMARQSLEYSISTWDPDETGGLYQPHHNTYDIEFYGPDGMCGTVYLGALTAMTAMASHLGHGDDAARYRKLMRKAAGFLDARLFNGEYYEQHVVRPDQASATDGSGGSDLRELLHAEGPKYQYGSGCLSDGVFGIWLAHMCGLDTPIDRSNTRSALQSIFRYNFKEDLADHANPQRPGYALGHESALVLCTWPRGGRPSLPFVYSEEAWTGIEYQVAGHLILEGFTEEGLRIVRAVRERYDGRIRNPWNEYECGSYYARAMASYGLIQAWSGFRYSKVSRTLWLAPQSDQRPFRTFFACDGAYGTLSLSAQELTIAVVDGEVAIETVYLDNTRLEATSGRASPDNPMAILL